LLAVGITALLLTWGLAGVLFRHVSAAHGEALRRIVAAEPDGRSVSRFSFIELNEIRDRIGGAGETAAVYLQPVVLRTSNVNVQTMAEIVDGRYFALTGMKPVLGRGLLPQDDRPASPPAAVISAPFWRRQFDASPSLVGATITANGASYTIVGVAEAAGSSSFLGASVDFWVSLAHADPLLDREWRTNVSDRWFTILVVPGGGLAAVDGRLAGAAQELARQFPDPWRQRRLQTTEGTVITGTERAAATMLVLVLGGLAVLIVLSAASNAAGVLLARAGANQRAAAIHLSIGAGRRAIVRRHLIEGALLGLAAGTIAVAQYAWARAALSELALLPTLALRLDLPLDIRTAAVAITAGALTGLLLAIGPALWATRVDLAGALRQADARGGGSGRLAGTRRVLAAVQVALSLVLIVGAGMFTRSLRALDSVDVGFARDGLVAMDFDVAPAVRTPDELPALARETLLRIAGLPMVRRVAMSNRAPIDQSTPTVDVQLGGSQAPPLAATMYLATEQYFDTVGVRLVRGRPFTSDETAAMADVVIVNERLAAQLWPDGDPLDRAIHLPAEARTLRVVGVARDSKYRHITELSQTHLYRPTRPALGLTLLARVTGDPRDGLRAIQRELNVIGPGLVGFFPRTLDDHLAVQLLPTRAVARTATVLGVLALLLSGVALYAVVAWFVILRQRELGIRMALGASPTDLGRLVVGQALGAAGPGIVAGALLAIGLSVLARSALFGVTVVDPQSFAAGGAGLLLVVFAAAYVPSRRASRTDASVLRN
jgi:predicted permease